MLWSGCPFHSNKKRNDTNIFGIVSGDCTNVQSEKQRNKSVINNKMRRPNPCLSLNPIPSSHSPQYSWSEMTGNVHRDWTHDQSVKTKKFRKRRVHWPWFQHFDGRFDGMGSTELLIIGLGTERNGGQYHRLIANHRYEGRLRIRRELWSFQCDFRVMSVSTSLHILPQSRESKCRKVEGDSPRLLCFLILEKYHTVMAIDCVILVNRHQQHHSHHYRSIQIHAPHRS